MAVGLNRTTLHDHRHHYVVHALLGGLLPQMVASQLGHKDASLVHKVDGKFVPRPQDFQQCITAG